MDLQDTSDENAAPHSSRLVRSFEEAFASHEHARAREVFNQHSLAIWFGVVPESLGDMLDEIVRSTPSEQDTTAAFRLFLASAEENRYFDPSVYQHMQATDDSTSLMLRLGYLFDLRLRGHAVEAYNLFGVLRGETAVLHPFADRRNNWPQFLAYQQGITAILAGRFADAHGHFAECLARPVVPGLEVMHRGSHVRRALIEAAFGDPQLARDFMDRAKTIPAGTGWADVGFDALADLVGVLLEPDPVKARQALSAVTLSTLSGMWPFYVFADYKVHDRVGAHPRIPSRLKQMRSLPLPRIVGEGFSGSVLSLAQGCHNLYSGATQDARALIEEADQNFFLSKLALALVETWSGNPSVALRLTNEVREDTVELRRAELWRVSIAAKAHVLLGDEAGAVSVLRELEGLLGPLRPYERNFFTDDVSEVGARHFTWWPEGERTYDAYFERLPAREQQLTDREIAILRLLAKGSSRPQMAQELFVTLNTLKTQLRTIYRKLGATTKTDAIEKAMRRGIL